MSRCDQIQSALNAFLDGEIGMFGYIKIRGHLSRCEACRARLEQYRAIKRATANVRQIPVVQTGRGRGLRLGVVVGLFLVALCFLVPRSNTPLALVYGKDPLAEPFSALYREGDFLVARDFASGKVLGSAPESNQAATYQMISNVAGGPMTNPKPFTIKLEGPPQDVIMLKGDVPPGEHELPTIIFFSGPLPASGDFFNIPVAGPEDRFFVKVLDPRLMHFLMPGDLIIEGPKDRTKPLP